MKALVENDHKPLEIRMLLRLQKYDFGVKHKPGKDLVEADILSRAQLPVLDPETEKEITYYVHTVVSNMPVSDVVMMQLRRATSEDEFHKVITFSSCTSHVRVCTKYSNFGSFLCSSS